MTGPRHRYLVGALGGLALVGASIGGLHLVQSASEPLTAASITGSFPPTCMLRGSVTMCAQPRSVPAAAGTPGTMRVTPYRDGVYAVTGHYLTPGGSESIGVTLTLVAGVVTAADVKVEATSPTARQFQDQFASRYATGVVAKDLSTVSVSRVAGASLTSVGFNDAITQIQSSAHA